MTHAELHWAPSGSERVCTDILATIPDWFGIPEANADYARMAGLHPTIVASVENEPAGLLTLVTHSAQAAEIHLIAVRADLHGRGIGTQMLATAERRLADEGIRFLQVKTLAASNPDPNYARTRAFYLSHGFVELEVFPTLWDEANPALQMIKTVSN